MVSIAVGCLVLAPVLSRRQRTIGALTGVATLVGAFILQPGLLGTLGRMFTGIEGDPSARSRTDSYDYAFHAFSQSPWVGKGFATFLPKYRILDNQWLLSAIKRLGIVGVVCFALLMAAVVRSGFRAEALMPTGEDRVLTRACVAAVLAVCISMLFYDGFAFPQATGLLFVVSGLAAASLRLADADQAQPEHSLRPDSRVSGRRTPGQ